MPRRRALVVGIEHYANARNNLIGVGNDVASFMRVLSNFDIHDVEVIRDANATSENIRTALNALVDGAAKDDVFVFYFSGHGALLPAGFAGSDDPDGRDEALVPYEGSTSSLILDNWIAEFLRQKLPPEVGAFFYGIYDCCHAGNMYKSVVLDVVEDRVRNLAKDDPQLKASLDLTRMLYVKEVDFTSLMLDAMPRLFQPKHAKTPRFKDLVLDEGLPTSVHFGAAEPEKTALVLRIDDAQRSVFTWALEQVARPGMTLEQIEKEVTEKQAQKTLHHRPVLSCRPADKARLFLQ